MMVSIISSVKVLPQNTKDISEKKKKKETKRKGKENLMKKLICVKCKRIKIVNQNRMLVIQNCN